MFFTIILMIFVYMEWTSCHHIRGFVVNVIHIQLICQQFLTLIHVLNVIQFPNICHQVHNIIDEINSLKKGFAFKS
jgi:hypothetical protein